MAKRKGNRAKMGKVMASVEQVEHEVLHKKKLLTRFTKMLLNGELATYVERQMNAIIHAFSRYAACSQVSYMKQVEVWETLGKEICPEYETLYKSDEAEFERLRRCGGGVRA